MAIIETLLEILKYTLPAIIVYLLIRQFLMNQLQVEALEKKAEIKKETYAIRMQAYERMVLFCERIKLSDLVWRLSTNEITASTLKNVIIVSIQKEYEHNITQQIYVSRQVWEMLQLLKDNTISLVTSAYLKNEKASADEFVSELLVMNRELELKLGSKVKDAIRKEVELYFQ